MSHYHALVWIDHSEAHVIHVSPDDVEKSVIHPKEPHRKLHSRVGTIGSGRAPEDQGYDHPTDGQLVTYALKYFRAKDLMV